MRGETFVVPSSPNHALPFQSTLPMRGETYHTSVQVIMGYDFNPLSPCGERLLFSSSSSLIFDFNPLSPCGERPANELVEIFRQLISIHSPHAGRDYFDNL